MKDFAFFILRIQKLSLSLTTDKLNNKKTKIMKLYNYKVEYENKGLKTRFFDTRRQVKKFVKKHPQFKCTIRKKGLFGLYNYIIFIK